MKQSKKPEQPKLFEEPVEKIRDDFPLSRPQPRSTDPDTSLIWSRYLDVEGLGAKCILCVYRHGELNSYDCADKINVTIANVSTMFTKLKDDGIFERVGKKDNRMVSKLTPLGVEFALRLIRSKN